MATGNATVETISPEMYQVNDTLVDFVPKQYANGHRHMYELDEAGKMVHVSRQYAHDTIEQSIVAAYGGTADEASDALLADYGHRAHDAHGAKLVTEPIAEPAENNVVNFRSRLFGERHPRAVRLLSRAVGVLALAGVLTAGASKLIDSAEATSHEPQTIEFTVSNAPVGEESSAPMSQAELQARYGGESTGEYKASELGFFNIDPANADQSLENLYNELRHNTKAQAFWVACFDTEAPSYAACVSDPAVKINADKLAAEYAAETLEHKAITAENLIAKFKNASFAGVSIENGVYKTVAVGHNGGFVAETNTRYNDPRLNFVFEFNGQKFNVQIRSCVQITENDVPTPLEIVTPPTTTTIPTPPEIVTPPTPPEEETPPTTVPEESTTTTTEGTTTTESTTTTTEGTTTTTEEETTTTSTTDTTMPTTEVTPPKNQTSTTNGESTTTVTAGDPTPEEPTTSTVVQPTTESTGPADTATSTTGPEGPVEPNPGNPNMDFVAPVGGIFGTSGLLIALRKRKLAKAKK